MFVCAGRSDGIQADGCFHEYGPQQVTGSFGADFVTDVVSGRWPVNQSNVIPWTWTVRSPVHMRGCLQSPSILSLRLVEGVVTV
jgi:hypothetical protein